MNQNQDNEHSITPKSFLMALSDFSLSPVPPPPLGNTDLLSGTIDNFALQINSPEFHVNGIRR